MSAAPDPLVAARQRHNSLCRHRGPNHPEVLQARRDLAAARLEKVISEMVAAAPPLTSAQRAHLAALLGGGRA